MSFVSHVGPETLPSTTALPLKIFTVHGLIGTQWVSYTLIHTTVGWEVSCPHISLPIRDSDWFYLPNRLGEAIHLKLGMCDKHTILQHKREVLDDFNRALLAYQNVLALLQG